MWCWMIKSLEELSFRSTLVYSMQSNPICITRITVWHGWSWPASNGIFFPWTPPTSFHPQWVHCYPPAHKMPQKGTLKPTGERVWSMGSSPGSPLRVTALEEGRKLILQFTWKAIIHYPGLQPSSYFSQINSWKSKWQIASYSGQ